MNAPRLIEAIAAVVLAGAIDLAGLAAVASLVSTPARPERSEVRIAGSDLFRPPVVAELASAAAVSAAAETVIGEDSGSSVTATGPSVKATAASADTIIGEGAAELPARAAASEPVVADSSDQSFTESSRAAAVQPVAADAPRIVDSGGNDARPAREVASASNVPAETTATAGSVASVAVAGVGASAPIAASPETTTSADALNEDRNAGVAAHGEVASVSSAPAETSVTVGSLSSVAVSSDAVSAPHAASPETARSAEAVSEDKSIDAGTHGEVAVAETPQDQPPVAAQSVSQSKANAAVIAALPPSEPQPRPRPLAAADIARVVANFGTPSCFLAVPKPVGHDGWSVQSYGDAAAVLDDFATYLKTRLPQSVELDRRTLQSGQCAAVDFANAFGAAAPGEFGFTVDQRRLGNGERLAATISGFNGRLLYVLLIDDDGVVQNVSTFVTAAGGTAALDVPVNLKGGGQAKTQLLLAIAASQPLSLLDHMPPTPLARLLPLLRGGIRASKAAIGIAVADFAVE